MNELNETEQKIVDAAAEVFLEKGIDGARTQAIADKAGINKALLHYYFRSKEKLYEIVAERVIKRAFSQVFTNVTETQDFEQWLQQFVHNYLVIIAGNPLIPRFMLWEIEAGGGRVAFILKDILKMNSIEDNPLIQIVNQAIENKQIRPVDPVHLLITLIASCIAPFIARPVLEKVLPGLDVRSKEFLRQREAAVVDLIWNGIKPLNCSVPETAPQTAHTNAWLFW